MEENTILKEKISENKAKEITERFISICGDVIFLKAWKETNGHPLFVIHYEVVSGLVGIKRGEKLEIHDVSITHPKKTGYKHQIQYEFPSGLKLYVINFWLK